MHARPARFTFDIDAIPFSRKLSLFSFRGVRCGGQDQGLYSRLCLQRYVRRDSAGTEDAPAPDPTAFVVRPLRRDACLPFSAEATPGMLSVRTKFGAVRICFDEPDLIRIRGRGMALLFESPVPSGGDSFQGVSQPVDCLDGTILAPYRDTHEFLFAAPEGVVALRGNGILAGSDSGAEWEVCVHFASSSAHRHGNYRGFESCVAEAEADYERWYGLYAPVDPAYEAVKRLAAYAVWICYVAPTGMLRGCVMLYEKNAPSFGWQCAYHALAVVKDADMAVSLLLSVFDYQDASGQLPDLMDERYIDYLSTKPPLQGFAFLHLVRRLGDAVTEEHCARMYGSFARWYGWWMECRDTDGDGVAQYNQGCECAMDTSAMFRAGVPVECPDLAAYLVLLAEALAVMAERLGKAEEARIWYAKSERLLETLVRDFWNGERFVARLSSSHTVVETDECDVYTPIILGKRLPREIIRKMASDLGNPLLYRTPLGIRHAPPDSQSPMAGVVGCFWQIKLAIGLRDAGEGALAEAILRDYCRANAAWSPALGYIADAPHDAARPNPGRWAALPCGIFLAMAGLLNEWSRGEREQ